MERSGIAGRCSALCTPGMGVNLSYRSGARHGNMPWYRTGVSRGHSRREETSPAKPERTYPAEGPNTEKGRTSMSSHDTMNPYGGVPMRRVVESFDPNERLKLWVHIHYPATAR